MNNYLTPENEIKRLNKLYSYNILDTHAETVFDDLTKMVSSLINIPIVLISLIDKERQWYKSKVGLDTNETPRDISFCKYAIMQNEIFEVENAHDDNRFNKNPLVTGKPNIVYYVGSPLTDNEGLNIGTLCAIDRSPRKLSESDRGIIKTVSNTIIRLIEFRKKQEDQTVYHSYQTVTSTSHIKRFTKTCYPKNLFMANPMM